MSATPPAPDLDPGLLEILRCPACRERFLPPEPERLVCSSCGLGYPVRGGVPVLLVDEASPSASA